MQERHGPATSLPAVEIPTVRQFQLTTCKQEMKSIFRTSKMASPNVLGDMSSLYTLCHESDLDETSGTEIRILLDPSLEKEFLEDGTLNRIIPPVSDKALRLSFCPSLSNDFYSKP
jgi:hypothetical protein